MFNSNILDVAIGMIFIYLLLSLMCSAAREIVELMLKKRSVDLERGIRELLAPGSDSGTADVVQKLYNHPLVNSLFSTTYQDSRIGNWWMRKLMRTHLPSYIPARTFALAIMDLVLPGSAAAPGAAPPAATASGAAGATPASTNFEVKLDAPPPPPLPAADQNSPLNRLREAVFRQADGETPLLSEHAKNALIPLIDAAGSDVAKARENIEAWFNSSMDRVSSWYKRRTQVIILILGLFVAVAVNADSIVLVKKLSTDKALRETLVAAAIEDVKTRDAESITNRNGNTNRAGGTNRNDNTNDNGNTNRAGGTNRNDNANANGNSNRAGGTNRNDNTNDNGNTNSAGDTNRNDNTNGNTNSAGANTNVGAVPSATPLPTPPECADGKNSEECQKAKAEALRIAKLKQDFPACEIDIDSRECKLEEKLQKICKKGERDSPQCRYLADQERLKDLGLPLGWESQGEKVPTSLGELGKTLKDHGLGWLLTAFAISLGAPFWFDLLNKFIVIRSAVKPHEKSPEEESKD